MSHTSSPPTFGGFPPGQRYRLLLLAAALLLLLFLHALAAGAASRTTVGMKLLWEKGHGTVADVTAGLPAQRGGVQPRDLLIAVAGIPISGASDYQRATATFRRGQPVAFQILREGQELTLLVTPGVPFPLRDFLLAVAISLAYLALAVVVGVQRADDPRSPLLFWFAYAVAMKTALPAVVVGRSLLSTLNTCALYLLSGVQAGLQLHLAAMIPQRHVWLERQRWVVPAFYGAGGGLALLAVWSFLADGGVVVAPPLLGAGAGGALLEATLPLWAVGVAVLVGSQALSHPSPTGRHQAGLVLLGVLPWVLYVLVTFALQRGGLRMPLWLTNLEPLVHLAYPVAVFVAIFRFQLFDLELVVRRSMSYATLTGLLLLLFYAGVGAGGALVTRFFPGQAPLWVVAGATLLLGLLFSPLYRRVQKFIERSFFPERQKLRQRLAKLAAELPTMGKLPLMGQHLVGQLREILAVRSVTLLLSDPSSRLLLTLATDRLDTKHTFEASFLLSPDDPGVQLLARGNKPLPSAVLAPKSAALAQRLEFFDAALAVPLLVSRRLVGLLLLGAKLSGEKFRAEELDLLELVALNVGAVFENALLYESATFDPLTGLLRRERILEQLERELARALRYGRPLSLALADLDNFKMVNDTYGHLCGDSLLTLVARSLSAGLRATDAMGRYGGEEFLLLFPETDGAGAVAVAEKLRLLVEELQLRTEDGQTLRTTISVGVASVHEKAAGHPVTATRLIALADSRLLAAKRGGRNRVVAG